MIVSSDAWNGRDGAQDFLAVPIEPLDRSETLTHFDVAFELEGHEWVVRCGLILPVGDGELVELDEDGPWLDEVLVDDVDAALDRIFTAPAPARARPGGFPLPRQTRMADLQIAGEGPKPVVIVSSDGFAAENGYGLVVGVRMTSRWNAPDPHGTSVVVHNRGEAVGRVVCTDIQTVPSSRLLRRSPEPVAVTGPEWDAILARVRQQLGLG